MADELNRIDLATSAVPKEIRAKRSLPIKTLLVVIIACVVVFAGITIVTITPIQRVIARARVVAEHGRAVSQAAENQDLEGVKTSLAATREAMNGFKGEYGKLQLLRFIPIIGRYIADGNHVIAASFAGLDAADKAVEALEPNADLLGFKGKSTFVSGTADERIQTAVKTMSALTPKIQEMAQSVEIVKQEIEAIDPNRYPTRIGKIPVRDTLVTYKNMVGTAANLFVNAQPLLTNLPSMLGEPNEKRYLVLFQNDKELRATGGFITAYAQFRIVRGKTILEKADDIYALDAAKTRNFPAPPEILTFHKNVYNFHIRDSNLSPDFLESMRTFEELFGTVAGRERIDGIWAVDTHVLVEALKILGPMYVYGREFSAETDSRCDCPKAVYELEDYATRPVNYVRTARKDIIGVLLQGILQKALGVSPSQYWGSLFQMLIREINEKHILAYFHESEMQKAAESFNMAGRIMTATETAALLSYRENNGWDYLHVNNSNMAGAKANMFVSEKVTKDSAFNPDGTITTKLMIEYKNPYPGSDCGLESGGLCLNAPLRNWLRVYTPAGSTLSESRGTQSPKDGNQAPMVSYERLGKTVFEGFLIVNPLGTARVEITYTSPASTKGEKYSLLIQKQPGTDGQEYTLKIDGKEKKKFILESDTEVEL